MDRFTAQENVEVHQPHLQFAEDSKIYHILKRWVDGGTMGVVSGLTVSISALNTTLIDIAAGWGYAPNGELVELTTGVASVALSSYTAGVDNYVCVVYAETATHPEATATGGRTATTRAERSYRVRVFTLGELNALVSTSTDMSVDARDRTLVVAVVNANGVAVALTTADLTLPASQPQFLSIQQPSSIAGVEFTAVASGTPTTAARISAGDVTNHRARLELQTLATPPGTAQLRYKAPSDASFGAAVVVGAGGSFTLASSTVAYTVTVTVTPTLLSPIAAQTLTEDYDVFEMYLETVRRGGARDETHRRNAGGTLPQVLNPHGQVLKNLSKIHEVPHAMFLGTELLSTQAKAIVPRIVTTQAPVGTSVRTYLWAIPLDSAGGRYIRMYVNNFQTFEITNNARWNGLQWAKDDVAQAASKFSVFTTGIATFARTAADPANWDDSTWTANSMFNSGLGGGSNQGLVSYGGGISLGTLLLGTLAGRDVSRVYSEYDNPGGGGQQRTLISDSRRSGGLNDERVLRVYRSSSSTLGTDSVEITLNAYWDTANNNWLKGTAGASAFKFEISRGFVVLYQRLAGSGQFVVGAGDVAGATGWDAPNITFNTTLGAMSAGGDVFTAGAVGYRYSAAKTFRLALSPAEAVGVGTGLTYSTNGGFTDPESGSMTVNMTAGGTDQVVWWPIRLPQGAIVTGASIHFASSNNNGGATNVRTSIVRQTFGAGAAQSFRAGATQYDTIPTAGAASYALTLDEAAGVRTIDNGTYTYMLLLHATGVGTVAYACRGADITFTVAEVQF